jgi:hypothetical protein
MVAASPPGERDGSAAPAAGRHLAAQSRDELIDDLLVRRRRFGGRWRCRRAGLHDRLALGDLSAVPVNPGSAFPGMPLRPAPLWKPILPPTYRVNAILLINDEIFYADFSKVETGCQLPLPVRCQPHQIVLEFRCRPARSKCIKDLISRIF